MLFLGGIMEEQLKKKKLFRMCPDCGRLITWNGYLLAFTHARMRECVYMEDLNGKRIYDDEMQENNVRKFEEEIQKEY